MKASNMEEIRKKAEPFKPWLEFLKDAPDSRVLFHIWPHKPVTLGQLRELINEAERQDEKVFLLNEVITNCCHPGCSHEEGNVTREPFYEALSKLVVRYGYSTVEELPWDYREKIKNGEIK